MMWRHRFLTNAWAWELPMGLVEEGETPAEAAAREVLKETGRRPGPVKPLIYAEPANGISDSQHHIFRADGATYEGPPTEKNESDRIEWIPLADVRGMRPARDRQQRLPHRAALRPHGQVHPMTWRHCAPRSRAHMRCEEAQQAPHAPGRATALSFNDPLWPLKAVQVELPLRRGGTDQEHRPRSPTCQPRYGRARCSRK